VTLHNIYTRLRIVSPPGLVSALGGSTEVALGSSLTIHPGQSTTLRFMFANKWGDFSQYSSANGVLILVDANSNVIDIFEVSIRIVSSS
jgi:hypothetical protein